MLPILLVSNSEHETEDFINTVQAKHAIHNGSVYRIRPEKKLLIEPIREVTNLISHYSQQKYVVVLYSFETASTIIQNTLLKTLEEESDHVQFILVVQDDSMILPTIRSRSETHRIISQKSTPQLPESLRVADLPHWMSATAKISKDEGLAAVDGLIHHMRSRLLQNPKNSHALHDILRMRKNMIAYNLNHEQVLDAIGHLLFQK